MPLMPWRSLHLHTVQTCISHWTSDGNRWPSDRSMMPTLSILDSLFILIVCVHYCAIANVELCTSCDNPDPVRCASVCSGQASIQHRCQSILPANATQPKSIIRIMKAPKTYDEAKYDCMSQCGRLLIAHPDGPATAAFITNWIWNSVSKWWFIDWPTYELINWNRHWGSKQKLTGEIIAYPFSWITEHWLTYF